MDGAWTAAVRAPFAVLGVRTDGRAVVALSYLPQATPLRAPAGLAGVNLFMAETLF